MVAFDALFEVSLKNTSSGKVRKFEKFAADAQEAVKLALAGLRETYTVERVERLGG